MGVSEIYSRCLDLAVLHNCSSGVLFRNDMGRTKEPKSFGEMKKRGEEQAWEALTQAGFYWTECDSSSPTL